MNAIQCYIPINLHIENLDGYNKRWHDKFLWIINSIVFTSLTNKKDFAGWVNLSSELLNKYLGNKYRKKVIGILISNGIIEPLKNKEGKEPFSVGAFSKAYRLTERYRNAGIRAVPIRKRTYYKKVEKYRQEYLKDVLNNDLIRHQFVMLQYNRINVDAAMEYIDSNYEKDSPQYKSRLIAIDQYDQMHKASFSEGRYHIDFTFKVNKGRVYSPVTMLARDLEQFTYFDNYEGIGIASFDMPTSQVCFYDHTARRLSSNLHNIGNDIIENNKEEGICRANDIYKSHRVYNTPYVVHNEAKPYPPKDRAELITSNKYSWQDVITNGLAYERLMFLMDWETKSDHYLLRSLGKKKYDKLKAKNKSKRDEFKEYFFGNLFYNQYRDRLTDLEMVFAEYYPNDFKQLRAVKRKIGNKALAVQVHKIEGYFFHTLVVNYMRTNHIDVPFSIKHDCISIPSKGAAYIYSDLNHLARQFFNRNEIKLKWEEK